jgi:hypothetical protein
MSLNHQGSLLERAIAGSLAGIAASLAYAVEQEADLRAFRYNADDLLLLGRLATSDRARARWAGLGIHLLNGAAAGAVYATAVRDLVPGPGWLRGTTFATAENLALYPFLALLENHHPAIRSGELAPYRNGTAFLQSIPRHIAFGAVLGTLTDVLLDRRQNAC